jgi:hypothetical protein
LNLSHLEKLKQLDVDLNKYLLTNIEKPEKLIKILNQNSSLNNKNEKFANIHFHE